MGTATDLVTRIDSSPTSNSVSALWQLPTVRPMRVAVDAAKCQGHNRCYALAPELFDVDDLGQSVVIGDGTVPPELVDKARLAVANCPEFAISVDEEDHAHDLRYVPRPRRPLLDARSLALTRSHRGRVQ